MNRLMITIGLVGMFLVIGKNPVYSFCPFAEKMRVECGPMIGYWWPELSDYNDELKRMGLDEIDGNWVVGGKCLHPVGSNLKVGFFVACSWIQSDKIIDGTVTETSLGVLLPALVGLYQIPFGKGTVSLGGGVGYYPVYYKKEITPPDRGTTISRLYGGSFGGQIMAECQYPVRDHISIVGEVAYVMGKVDELYQAGERILDAPEIDLSGLMIRLGCRCKFSIERWQRE
jgi:hypothetical protein